MTQEAIIYSSIHWKLFPGFVSLTYGTEKSPGCDLKKNSCSLQNSLEKTIFIKVARLHATFF